MVKIHSDDMISPGNRLLGDKKKNKLIYQEKIILAIINQLCYYYRTMIIKDESY